MTAKPAAAVKKETSKPFSRKENPKTIFESEVLARPESAPLSARWLAAAWSPAYPKGELPLHFQGGTYTSGLKPLVNPDCWIEIDPRPERQARIVKLRETLLNPSKERYFDLNYAAEDGTVAAQTEALYLMLAELISW